MDFTYELVKPEENLPVRIILHRTEEEIYVPRHWHDSVEISYVCQGRIDEIYIDGTTYTSEKGDIVVINSNAIHSFSVAQGKDRLALTVLIPYEFIKANYPDIDGYTFECISRLEQSRERLLECAHMRHILDRIAAIYLNGVRDPLTDIEIKALTYNLLFVLLKHFTVPKPNSSLIKTNKHLDRLTNITSYMKLHYNQELSIEILAGVFGFTKEYLSRFFQKHMGMTVLQYINAIRLEYAFRDLMNTDHSITRIALDHGFPNEKSFTRVFKAAYKETPHDYRRKRLGKVRICPQIG